MSAKPSTPSPEKQPVTYFHFHDGSYEEKVIYLTSTQIQAINALLACGDRSKVCVDMGIPPATLDKWLSDKEINAYHVALARQKSKSEALTQEFVDAKLVEFLNNEEMLPQHRASVLKAACERVRNLKRQRPGAPIKLEVFEGGPSLRGDPNP